MMKKQKKIYDDDDGRSIADMSGIDRPTAFSHVPRVKDTRKSVNKKMPDEENTSHGDDFSLTKEERKWYVLGALKAAMLIGLVFIVCLGLIVFLLTLFWS